MGRITKIGDMKKLLKGIKDSLNQIFAGSQKKGMTTGSTEFSSLNKGRVNPGLEEKSEDIGKKVFEKTGRIREGVGQSSTVKTQAPRIEARQKRSEKPAQKHIERKVIDKPKIGLEDIRKEAPLVPQETPVKTNQGQKNRKPYKKYNKKRNGGFKNKDQEKNNP